MEVGGGWALLLLLRFEVGMRLLSVDIVPL